jgi:hypothetical protein
MTFLHILSNEINLLLINIYFSKKCLDTLTNKNNKLIRRFFIVQEGCHWFFHYCHIPVTTASWSSGLRSRLRNRGSGFKPRQWVCFCYEQLHLLTSHGCIHIFIYITYKMYDICMFIRYLVSITQDLKDT